MPAVYLSHPSDKLDHYFGARATEALRSLAEVRFNREPRELSTAELVADARGCDYLIAYRQTAGPESLFRDWPELRAFIRCAMDIRTVDVAAASAHGVLVTRASAGFVPAVAEWIVAMMVNLGRDLVRHAEAGHREAPWTQRMGRQLHGSTLGVIGLGRIGRHLARPRRGPRHAGPRERPECIAGGGERAPGAAARAARRIGLRRLPRARPAPRPRTCSTPPRSRR